MNINNFDLNLLRMFDALMRERSVTKAADRVCLSQPAMSNALNRLRELLQDPLFVRTSRGMQPTPKAIQLEVSIREALTIIENGIKSEQLFDPSSSSQTFHLATTDYVELAFLPALTQHLSRVAPLIRIEIHSLGPDIPVSELEEGVFDFSIGRFCDPPKRLDSTFWRSEELVCLVREKHPLVKNDIDFDCFLSIPQIWVNGGQRTGVVDKWLKENALTRNVVHTTPSFLIAPNIVAKSDMLVVTPISIAKYFSAFLPVKIIPLPMTLERFDLHIISHPYHSCTPAHKWLVDTIENLE